MTPVRPDSYWLLKAQPTKNETGKCLTYFFGHALGAGISHAEQIVVGLNELFVQPFIPALGV